MLLNITDPRDRAIVLAIVQALNLFLVEANRALDVEDAPPPAQPPPGLERPHQQARRPPLRLIQGGDSTPPS